MLAFRTSSFAMKSALQTVDTAARSIGQPASWQVILSVGGARALMLLHSARGTFGEIRWRLKHVCSASGEFVDTIQWMLQQRSYYKANRSWIDQMTD